MNLFQPQDGVCVVTGAGSGLGRALAIEMCKAGFVTFGLGRRADALAQTQAVAGSRFQACVTDISLAEEVTATFQDIVRKHEKIAILINNAAIYPKADFLGEAPDHFLQAVDINLCGMALCSHAALRNMAQSGEGRILNVATFADLNPLPASSAYSVSKGAARILTRALIADVCDRFPGIVISDWMPGMLKTGMGIPDGLDPEQAAQWGAALARTREASFTGTTFEMDREVLPPRSAKRKLKDLALLRRAPKSRQINW